MIAIAIWHSLATLPFIFIKLLNLINSFLSIAVFLVVITKRLLLNELRLAVVLRKEITF